MALVDLGRDFIISGVFTCQSLKSKPRRRGQFLPIRRARQLLTGNMSQRELRSWRLIFLNANISSQLSLGLRQGARRYRQLVGRDRHVLRPTAEPGVVLVGVEIVRVVRHAEAHREHAEPRIQGHLRVLREFRQLR